MTLNSFIRRVCKLEGKKKSVSVGNVREVLKCMKIVVAEDTDAGFALWDYLDGCNTGKKAKPKKKKKR